MKKDKTSNQPEIPDLPLPNLPPFNNIPCYIFWKDSNLTYQGGNDQFLQAIGLKSAKELIGKTDYDMPWSAEAELYRESDLLILSGKRLLSKELRWLVNGHHYIIVNKLPIKDAQDRIVGILGIHQDVTEFENFKSEDITSSGDELDPNPLLRESEQEIFYTLRNISDTQLTHREVECLSLWLSGYSIKESSYCLDISHKSIEAYRKSIKDKMGVHHKYQLIELMEVKGVFHLFLSLAKIIQAKVKSTINH